MPSSAFLQHGFEACGQVIDPAACGRLLAGVEETRDFNALFLSEEEFRSDPKRRGTNPRPGRNLLGRMECDFIFANEFFGDRMRAVLGPAWRVLDHKFVVGVPDSWLLDWIQQDTYGLGVANLGAYVRPEYRDMTYFHGIDFHQDIIDFKTRSCDFVTVYIYLDDTSGDASPLHVVPGSHDQGVSKFPHTIETQGMRATYSGDGGSTKDYEIRLLTGPAGSMYFWHPAILHGTMPHRESTPRISVRILAEKNDQRILDCELDQLNSTIDGPLAVIETRGDMDETGHAIVRGNTINTL